MSNYFTYDKTEDRSYCNDDICKQNKNFIKVSYHLNTIFKRLHHFTKIVSFVNNDLLTSGYVIVVMGASYWF